MNEMFDRNLYRSKWCLKISDILNKLGLNFLWNINDISLNKFKNGIKLRLRDITLQEWLGNIDTNTLCQNYKIFKDELKFEPYLALPNDLRIPVTRYRTGSHHLPISNQRYNPIDERNLCPLCSLDTGDEYHYILICPSLENDRKIYIPSKYYNNPNVLKFKALLSTANKTQLTKLAKFIKIILYIFRPDVR